MSTLKHAYVKINEPNAWPKINNSIANVIPIHISDDPLVGLDIWWLEDDDA